MDSIVKADRLLYNVGFALKAGRIIKFLNFLKTATAVVSIVLISWNVLFRIFNDPVTV